jgi:hypothetical protein
MTHVNLIAKLFSQFTRIVPYKWQPLTTDFIRPGDWDTEQHKQGKSGLHLLIIVKKHSTES